MAKIGRPNKYPWERLQVDESFAMDATLRSARVMAAREGKKLGRKFKVGVEWMPDETDPEGVAGKVEYVFCTRVQ